MSQPQPRRWRDKLGLSHPPEPSPENQPPVMDSKSEQISPSSGPGIMSMPAPHAFAGASPGDTSGLDGLIAPMSLHDPLSMPSVINIAQPIPTSAPILRGKGPRTIKAICGRDNKGVKASKESIILRGSSPAEILKSFQEVYRLTDNDIKDVIFYVQFKGSEEYIRVAPSALGVLMEQEDVVKIWIAPSGGVDPWHDWFSGTFSC